MDDGILILAGRTLTTDYSSHGIAIFEARDDDHMRDIAQNDPAVIQLDTGKKVDEQRGYLR